MSTDTEVLTTMAEAFEAAAAAIRRNIALAAPAEASDAAPSVAARARALHPQIGKRQLEVLAELDKSGLAGTNTGVISRALKYDQPNVYLTLNNMKDNDFVEKDESTDPHTYRLGRALRTW